MMKKNVALLTLMALSCLLNASTTPQQNLENLAKSFELIFKEQEREQKEALLKEQKPLKEIIEKLRTTINGRDLTFYLGTATLGSLLDTIEKALTNLNKPIKNLSETLENNIRLGFIPAWKKTVEKSVTPVTVQKIQNIANELHTQLNRPDELFTTAFITKLLTMIKECEELVFTELKDADKKTGSVLEKAFDQNAWNKISEKQKDPNFHIPLPQILGEKVVKEVAKRNEEDKINIVTLLGLINEKVASAFENLVQAVNKPKLQREGTFEPTFGLISTEINDAMTATEMYLKEQIQKTPPGLAQDDFISALWGIKQHVKELNDKFREILLEKEDPTIQDILLLARSLVRILLTLQQENLKNDPELFKVHEEIRNDIKTNEKKLDNILSFFETLTPKNIKAETLNNNIEALINWFNDEVKQPDRQKIVEKLTLFILNDLGNLKTGHILHDEDIKAYLIRKIVEIAQ